MKGFARRLTASGELVSAEGLAGPDQARRVRAGENGEPVTDGVFPESKEFLAGFWIVDVDSAERALAIAAEASAAPGPSGPLRMAIEVRQVPYGHFDLYYDAPFEELVAEQIHFLQVHLGLADDAHRPAQEATS